MQLDLFKNPSRLMNGSVVNPHGVFCEGLESLQYQHKKKPWVHLNIEFAQLENGMWIAARSCHTQNFGMGFGLSAKFCKQFPSRNEAIISAFKGMEKYLRSNIDAHHSTAEDKAIAKSMIEWMESQAALLESEEAA